MPRTSPCRCCRSGRHREVFFHCSAGGTEHSMSPLCHPAACSSFTRKLSRVRCCCRGGGEKAKQNKTNHSTLGFLSFLHSQPLLCHPCWNAPPNSSLRAAAGFASDCLQRLRFSHTPDHGEGSPMAPCRLPITPSTACKRRQSSKSRALLECSGRCVIWN